MRLYAQHIDVIAREKQRDVLFIHFEDYVETDDQESDSVRDQVLAWLETNEIPFEPCLGFEGEDEIQSYLGDVYVDIAYDEKNKQYQLLKDYLEDEEGNMKIEGVFFFVLSLEDASDDQQADFPDEDIHFS